MKTNNSEYSFYYNTIMSQADWALDHKETTGLNTLYYYAGKLFMFYVLAELSENNDVVFLSKNVREKYILIKTEIDNQLKKQTAELALTKLSEEEQAVEFYKRTINEQE